MKLLQPVSAGAVAAFALGVPCTDALDNGFTRPPMGWSALYGAPFGTVNETNVWEAAAGLNASGLVDLGYKYVRARGRKSSNDSCLQAGSQPFAPSLVGTLVCALIHSCNYPFVQLLNDAMIHSHMQGVIH